jgi:methylated-DNA-[protein]-cysteine S-methyltransferase
MQEKAYWLSPLGWIKIVAEAGALLEVQFVEAADETGPATGLLGETSAQLEAYFQGKLRAFSLPLHLKGTAFQQAVYTKVAAIPYGSTRTYGELAAQLDNPGAVRAVGAANGKNPLLIVVPCHRVVSPAGKLTGYAGGLWRKEHLLKLEEAAPHATQLSLEL